MFSKVAEQMEGKTSLYWRSKPIDICLVADQMEGKFHYA